MGGWVGELSGLGGWIGWTGWLSWVDKVGGWVGGWIGWVGGSIHVHPQSGAHFLLCKHPHSSFHFIQDSSIHPPTHPPTHPLTFSQPAFCFVADSSVYSSDQCTSLHTLWEWEEEER